MTQKAWYLVRLQNDKGPPNGDAPASTYSDWDVIIDQDEGGVNAG